MHEQALRVEVDAAVIGERAVQGKFPDARRNRIIGAEGSLHLFCPLQLGTAHVARPRGVDVAGRNKDNCGRIAHVLWVEDLYRGVERQVANRLKQQVGVNAPDAAARGRIVHGR